MDRVKDGSQRNAFTAKVALVFPPELLMTHFVCKLVRASSPLLVLWLACQEAPACTGPFWLERPINLIAGFLSQGLVKILEVKSTSKYGEGMDVSVF